MTIVAKATTPQSGKVIYTAKTHTTGGRENGAAKSSDGQLEIKLSTPGTGRPGTNPEQLFAAGWSACFEGAIGVVAQKRKIAVSPAIDAEVNLHMGESGFFISATLNVSLPGIAHDVAEQILQDAHAVCPYSKATRGNIDVTIKLV
jgi:Ohr subfamily peroxiredoxin